MGKITNLADITKAEFRNHPIHIRCIVSGKNTIPYMVPKRVRIRCKTQECSGGACPYKDKGLVVTLGPEEGLILLFIEIPNRSMPNCLRQAFGISCKAFSHKILESQNVLRIFISQPPGGLQTTKWMGERVAYFLGHDIGTSITYILSGYQTPDPKTQTTTWVFDTYKRTKTDIETFSITEKGIQELRAFQVLKADTAVEIIVNLEELYETYALNITNIYKRWELHLAIDLVFHSALKFKLGTSKIVPAWMDAIVIGDTRCGKGYVAEGMSNYYGVGEVVNAEACSYAGLVGGVAQIDKYWVVKWGRLPVNDGGLVIVDEASNLVEEWTRLSRIRSEGIAQVTKIQQQAVNSRTRVLWLSNPPLKAMTAYSYGIEALPDLVHAPEDIARFDYGFIVASKDVALKDINVEMKETRFMFPQSLERQLIMWIWSRKPDQIIFTDKAMKEILDLSIRLGERFDITIPLIQGENVRFKLGKIAIAFAGRMFSASDDGEDLIVDKIHVDCAALFLWYIYGGLSNGYSEYSKQRHIENPELIEKSIKAITHYFKSYMGGSGIIFNYLLQNSTINTREIQDFMGCNTNVSTEVVSKLIQHHCIIRKGPNYYVKTPHFTEWLRSRARSHK